MIFLKTYLNKSSEIFSSLKYSNSALQIHLIIKLEFGHRTDYKLGIFSYFGG